jgi:hypothetical protein
VRSEPVLLPSFAIFKHSLKVIKMARKCAHRKMSSEKQKCRMENFTVNVIPSYVKYMLTKLDSEAASISSSNIWIVG